jgi:hypothetical protein
LKLMKTSDFMNSASSFMPVLFMTILGFANPANGQSVREVISINLEGKSSGGILTFRPAFAGNFPHVALTNAPGESSGSVLRRLAIALTNCSAIANLDGGANFTVEATETKLMRIWPPFWIFGGTESGFGIPDPPHSFSLSYDRANGGVTMLWANPPGGFDWLAIIDGGVDLATLPGTATRYVLTRKGTLDAGLSSGDGAVLVMGFKGKTPSNGTVVRLSKQTRQESFMNAPFTRGVAPSFQTWTNKARAGDLVFEQGNWPDLCNGTNVGTFQDKRYYQTIKGRGAFTGGVSRRFLGLTPGHTYRVSSRMNTLETKQGNWSFSFHAAYNPSSGEDLTPAQMAGDEALPNGTKGKAAGQIAKYDSTTTTDGKWVERSSEKKTADNPTGDITLPAKGSDSITIWFRFEGKDVADVAVGLDSVTIEDLGKAESGTKN